MMRPTLATTIALALAAALLGGCGKSPTTSSYSQLTHVSTQPTSVAAPVAQGYAPSTTSSPPAAKQSGALLLSLSSLVDAAGTVDALTIELTGAGLAQPLSQRLTASEMQSSNTLDFEHIPSGVLTATLTALDKSGATLGTKTANVTVGTSGQTKVLFKLKAAPFDFTVADPSSATDTTPPADNSATTTPAKSSPQTSTTTTGSSSSDAALGVEIISKVVSRKFLLFKRLAVTVRVTNHNTSETLNGQVIVAFHKTTGIFSKTDSVVQTLTSPVTALAPGKSVDITLQSTQSAEDAEATVHTVLASASSSGN